MSLGGLCGTNWSGLIINCYAIGSVSGGGPIGGLCGLNYYGTIINCYATGSVSGGGPIGGLCAHNVYGSTITNCFWDIETGGPDNGLGTPLSTSQMQTLSTFTDAGWDFIDIWNIGENQTYPYLRTYSPADMNKDGIVDLLDFTITCERWLEER
jgi:hypothetical protein